MKQLTFSIKDNKTGIYHRPMYLPHPQQAVRQFEQIVNDPQSTINRYPEDYQLVQLGEFDDETGSLLMDTHYLKRI